MKNTLCTPALITLLVAACTSQISLAQDASSVLNIDGRLVPVSSQCNIRLSETLINLEADTDTLNAHVYDTKPTNPHRVHISVDGDADCEKAKNEGHIQLQFYSNPDLDLGTDIMNMAQGEGAAKGVAIALYDGDDNKMQINKSTLLATEPAQTIGLELVKMVNRNVMPGAVQAQLSIYMNRL